MELKILCVHGAGSHPIGGAWESKWKTAISKSLGTIDGTVTPVIDFIYLDDIFSRYPISARDIVEAIAKLAASGAASLFRQPKGIGNEIRLIAAMVVQWVEEDQLRQDTRERLGEKMIEFKPNIVCGHSLGSLICYDAFTGNGADLIKGRRFISCGSQIGNPFVIGNFAAGRLSSLSQAKFWYHLYNKEDNMFTAEIRLPEPNFAQIDTFFDIQGIADHDVTEYMHHRQTLATVWSDALMDLHGKPLERTLPFDRGMRKTDIAKPIAKLVKPQKRALLVGINEYPDPSQNLEGCVNDVFLMSELLQESGFDAENIRIVLNNRATHQGVRERLEWLLDDAKGGDTRFFYYSGHGTQLPAYGIGDRVDKLDEALVLYDFDWTRERAFTDDDFYMLYSQLPYDLHFLTAFDCCYSAGMARAPVRTVRGIDPPDDIRHRMLRWDPEHAMWVERKIEPPNPEMDRHLNDEKAAKTTRHSTHRLGQAMDLRVGDKEEMQRKSLARDHKGPYMPVMFYASSEEEFSFEYRHGPIAYGAFTYCLVKTLRRDRRLGEPQLTFNSLTDAVSKELAELGYQQHPALVAPTEIRGQKIPLNA